MASSTLEFKLDDEKSIITALKKTFSVVLESSNLEQKIISRLEINHIGKKIVVVFYTTGKCLIQGSGGEAFDSIKKKIIDLGLVELKNEKTSKYISDLDENNFYKEKDFIVGFDEAGIGETIGSAIFAAVILSKENLSLFASLKKDIKSLSLRELNYYSDLMKKSKIRYEYVKASAYEVSNSGFTKNRLMDKKYVELTRKLSSHLNKSYILMLDDYGVKEDIKGYFANLDKQGIRYICRDKLDENITACKLASIIARQIRYSELEMLDASNRLQLNGAEVSFGKGASNEQTSNWLKTFRILNPTLDFPDFVRKSWGNVIDVEKEMPRKIIPLHFDCKYCNNRLKRIFAYHTKDEDSLSFYCSSCHAKIDKVHLKNQVFPYILTDTNSLIIGTVSHDLRSTTSIFNGSRLLIPHKIMDEIDTIGKGRKLGAHKEIERLKEFESQGKINIHHCDFEVTSPFDADKKLYDLIAKNNSCALITADKNLALNAYANDAFVFHLINYIPQPKQIVASSTNISPAVASTKTLP